MHFAQKHANYAQSAQVSAKVCAQVALCRHGLHDDLRGIMSDIKNIDPNGLATLEEFDCAIEFVAEECARIEMQIISAKGAAQQTGEYADSDWFARVNAALRMAKAKKQTLARKRADLAKQKRKESQDTRERMFIEFSRALLPKDKYLAIWDEVDRAQNNL